MDFNQKIPGMKEQFLDLPCTFCQSQLYSAGNVSLHLEPTQIMFLVSSCGRTPVLCSEFLVLLYNLLVITLFYGSAHTSKTSGSTHIILARVMGVGQIGRSLSRPWREWNIFHTSNFITFLTTPWSGGGFKHFLQHKPHPIYTSIKWSIL